MQADLPTSVSEWVNLAWQLVLIIAAVSAFLWRILRAPLVQLMKEADATNAQAIHELDLKMEQTTNGVGQRVKVLEEGCMQHGTLIDKHDRAVERLENAVALSQERTARMEAKIDNLVTAIERNRDAHLEEDGEIRERLVRIETKVDALQQASPPASRRSS